MTLTVHPHHGPPWQASSMGLIHQDSWINFVDLPRLPINLGSVCAWFGVKYHANAPPWSSWWDAMISDTQAVSGVQVELHVPNTPLLCRSWWWNPSWTWTICGPFTRSLGIYNMDDTRGSSTCSTAGDHSVFWRGNCSHTGRSIRTRHLLSLVSQVAHRFLSFP